MSTAVGRVDWRDLQRLFKNKPDAPIYYDGVGDGVHDDTNALRELFAATPPGGVAHIPAGVWRVSEPEAAQLFLLNNAIRVKGDGHGSIFLLRSTMSASADLFRLAPSGLANEFYSSFEDFTVACEGDEALGRHAFNLDTSVSGTFLSGTQFQRLYINATLGDAIHTTNPADGIGHFHTTIEGCTLFKGIHLVNAGDSISILGNIISGSSYGILASLIPGAGKLVIGDGNNISAAAGAIILDGGISATIENNLFEQSVANTEQGAAMIHLRGASGTLTHALIHANQMQAIPPSSGNPKLILVENASFTDIDFNRLSPSSNQPPIVITSAAKSTRVGSRNIVPSFAGLGPNAYRLVDDSGQGTIFSHTGKLLVWTGTVAVSNTTALSVLGIPATIRGYSLQGNDIIRIKAAGTITASNAAASNVSLLLAIIVAGQQMCGWFTNLTTNLTGAGWSVECDLLIPAIGAAGSISCGANSASVQSYLGGAGAPTGPTTFDLTADTIVELVVEWGAAAASNTITCTSLTVDHL